jgi:hypothetical protein
LSPTHHTFLFPQLKIKLKGHHFDTIVMIEAKSQAVLNTLEEHDFQDAFKKIAEALGTVHTHERGLLQGQWWPIGPKLILDQMAAPVPEIGDGSMYKGTACLLYLTTSLK